jgi:hypothetical protein
MSKVSEQTSINKGVAIGSSPTKLHGHSAATGQETWRCCWAGRPQGNSGGEWPGWLCARGKRGGFSLKPVAGSLRNIETARSSARLQRGPVRTSSSTCRSGTRPAWARWRERVGAAASLTGEGGQRHAQQWRARGLA